MSIEGGFVGFPIRVIFRFRIIFEDDSGLCRCNATVALVVAFGGIPSLDGIGRVVVSGAFIE